MGCPHLICSTLVRLVNKLNPPDKEAFLCAAVCICDAIWSTRNCAIFKNIEKHGLTGFGEVERFSPGDIEVFTDASLLNGAAGLVAIFQDLKGTICGIATQSTTDANALDGEL
ncbi:hypothetical protein TorRG33x02_294560 [Trema orientale]|uniref:Uncharacterized protein n=1 Tax=Trema orientale TaxID=63057 RepID=A0A2P5C7W5_TREOI|nr:hypothetical protein TorRG33x02_294560 [Trema orientale]